MKKLFLISLLLLFTTVQAEMVWVGVNPTVKSSSKSSEAVIETSEIVWASGDNITGTQLKLVVNDSSANADSIYATWYSYPINTEDVITATGLLEFTVLDDSSTTAPSPFAQEGDSVYGYYRVMTGHIPYDATTDFEIVARTVITAVSGTAIQVPLTLAAVTAGVDTLFKAWTWFEVEIIDTTRWGDLYTQYFRVSGTGDSAATIAGTYNTTGFDKYKHLMAGSIR